MFSASKTAAPATAGGYQISNSLRFRSSATAYLSRTYTSSATWTLSLWVKRGMLSAVKPMLGSAVKFNANDTLTAGTLTTTAVYRDPSAWYHIVVSNNGCYINGTSIGSVTTSALTNASIGSDGTNYFDGYMADINFIDGQALTPSSFGEYNVITGVWQPKQYSGTYGTNGFKLNFSNGTSTTTLGYDSSGNGNNWTTNNISLTAGSTYDWMLDSPTPYQGSSYGVGNYAVLNPLVQSANTFSNGNLTLTASASTPAKFVSSIGATSGKWYMEFGLSALSNASIGISKDTTPRDYLGMSDGSSSVSFWPASSGTPIYVNGSSVAWSGSGTTWTTSDIAGLALDVDASTIAIYKNGVLVGSAFSYSSYWTGLTYFAGGNYISGLVYTANFGQRPFAYTPPSGYKSLCTYNLPTPTIQNGASYMAATLYTGTNATQSISNSNNSVSFQPDFVWIKNRANSGADHALVDSVRGAAYWLASNLTQAESNNTAMVTSINSNGFTVGASNMTNQSGVGLVGWQWKAGGTAVTNTAGSITSQVSANTTSGFSVVTYTGNGTNPGATIGHGLGVTPSMIITKSRSATGEWPSYHVSIGVTNTLYLNATYAASTYVNRFSAVSSTTFTTGSNGSELNTNGTTYVAYCFAAIPGYSAFGSYTGNGSSDGPFVYCGFRPRYVLYKRTDSAANWIVIDTSTNPYNVATNYLQPNLSNAEGSDNVFDIVSNGLKFRSSSSVQNASGGTYIYAAFAENPFNYSLAR